MIIAIDPGLTGAISVIYESDNKVIIYDVPVESHGNGKCKNRVSIDGVIKLSEDIGYLNYKSKERCIVCIESVSSRPGQGVAGVFSLGYTYGVLKSLFMLNTFSDIIEIRPVSWKKHYGLIKANKEESIYLAKNMFKDSEYVSNMLARKKDHNRAEALLIGLYAKEIYGGPQVWKIKQKKQP